MTKALTKAGLVSELSASTSIARRDVGNLLNSLADLAYKEAGNGGFTLPGLCKFKVVRRKATRRFNPVTRGYFIIGEHDVLKIVPLKKAKSMITPLPPDLVKILPPVEKSSSHFEKTRTPLSAARDNISAPADENGSVIFSCPHCGNTLMAQPENRGQKAECSACNGQITVPEQVPSGRTEKTEPESSNQRHISDFVTFVCTACDQEIEAPLEMIGMEADCPACGSTLHIPDQNDSGSEDTAASNQNDVPGVDRSSMTIRMDLSDFIN